MVAVFRYAPDGRPLTGAYLSPDELPEVILDTRNPVVIPGITTIRREPVVLIQVPIDHGGYGPAGFDIIATYDGTTADVALTSSEDPGSDQANLQAVAILQAGVPDQSSEPLRFEIGGESRVAAADRFRTGWYTIVHQSESVLFESVRADTGVFLGVVVAGLVLGLLSRRTLAETGQLKLLLNEVHHRVKNDITLMNSFLSLKAFDADAPEAQKMLLTMGRVYELLHRSGEQRIAIDRHLEEFSADTKTAIPLAIIANELLTNAANYGAREEKTVRVRVSLGRVGEKGVSLTVSDDGPPFSRDAHG